MSARISRFGAFGSSSGRGKAAGAVIACGVMLLAGCGGGAGSSSDAGAPVIRGNASTEPVEADAASGQVRAAAGVGEVVVSWFESKTSLTQSVIGYVVQVTTDGGGTWTGAGTGCANDATTRSIALTCTATDLAAGTYSFRIATIKLNTITDDRKTTDFTPGSTDVTVIAAAPAADSTLTVSASSSASPTASNEIAVPLPANLKVVRFYATESPTSGVAGTMASQSASKATALTRNAFTRTDLSFVGWRDNDYKYYANEATYAFDKDVILIGEWRSPGTPFNIVAKFTALTSASVTFQAAPNLDGTPAAVRSYDVSVIRKGMKVDARKVTGPGTYDFAVQRDYPYVFKVEDQGSNEIVSTSSAVVNTITFNPNGGNGSMASQSASKATALTPIANAIKRTGYEFNRWDTSASGNGTAYAEGASYPFAASETLYATWGCLPLTVKAKATRLGARSASVDFTASSSESPWTSFTASSAKEGVKASTLDTWSKTGTIPVSGLKSKSGYTFDVTATNAAGCVYTTRTNRVEMWM